MTAQFTLIQDVDITHIVGENAPNDHRLVCCISDCVGYSNGRIQVRATDKQGMLEYPVIPPGIYVPEVVHTYHTNFLDGIFNYYQFSGILSNATRATFILRDILKRAACKETDVKMPHVTEIDHTKQLSIPVDKVSNREVFDKLMNIYFYEVEQAEETDSWVMEFMLGRYCLTLDPKGFSVTFPEGNIPVSTSITNGNWGNELYSNFLSSYLGKRAAHFKSQSDVEMVSAYSLLDFTVEPKNQLYSLKKVPPLEVIYNTLTDELLEHAKRSARLGVINGLVENANITILVAVVNGEGRTLFWRQHTVY